MSDKYLSALANANERIKDQRRALLAVTVLGVIGMVVVKAMPVRMQLNLSPSLRPGDVVEVRHGVAQVPPPNVYAFAYYIWQQVNRWSTNGQKDYGQQIYNMQNYLTPACLAQLTVDVQERNQAGELATRTRTLSEAPGQRYASWRVKTLSEDAWQVQLDLELFETIGAVPVKSALIRYPMRVVRYDIDPEKNPFGLAVDCFGAERPTRLQAADLPGAAALPGAKTAATNAGAQSGNPGAPVPTSLPRATAH
jgi:integrating conjugative element protein (TIGR03746 family)